MHDLSGLRPLSGVHFVSQGVLKDRAPKDVSALAIPEEGEIHEEDGEFLFAVLLVPGLVDLDRDMTSGLRVAQGENRTTGEEEGGEAEGVNVGADELATWHSVFVLEHKYTAPPPNKKINGELFFSFFPKPDVLSGGEPKALSVRDRTCACASSEPEPTVFTSFPIRSIRCRCYLPL